jgi:hypothetical protein
MEAIGRCHNLNAVAAEPQCLLLTGPTGAGKSTLLATYAHRYPTAFVEAGVHRPIVQATIMSRATVKNLATMILLALGDPRAGTGTEGSMTLRIMRYFGDCQVEMLILDELQHFVDQDSSGRILQNASNWLKTLIKETRVACVLTGLQREAEQVVSVNPQLARLFGDPYMLEPFRWDETRPETVQEFRAFLEMVEQQLPLREPSYLASMDIARRCFVACDGVIGYLMRLLRGACHFALAMGIEHLDVELLAAAFDERLAMRRRGKANPFVGALPELHLPIAG